MQRSTGVGRIASKVTQVLSSFPNESWSYIDDELHRMTVASNLSDHSNSQSFQYDAVGRITYNSRVGYYTYPRVGMPRPHAPTAARVGGGVCLGVMW